MMSRYAHEYWIRAQVARALRHVESLNYASIETGIEDKCRSADVGKIQMYHDEAIFVAAKALLEAELLHRQIVSRQAAGEPKESGEKVLTFHTHLPPPVELPSSSRLSELHKRAVRKLLTDHSKDPPDGDDH